jgi:hypothetical protein
MSSAIDSVTLHQTPARGSPQTGNADGGNAPSSTGHGRPFPNPTLRLDATLGMVVLEFRDDQGSVKSTIPSQRVLEAYRTHSEPIPGQQTSTIPDKNNAEPDSEKFA